MGASAWADIASSADGSRLAAVVSGGYIYTSTDGGVTWTERRSAGRRGWRSIASSADGTRLAATCDYIYTSADGGATWTQAAFTGPRQWRDIACSADGAKLAAVVWTTASQYPYARPPGYLYTSSDGGESWIPRASAGSRRWDSVACSADGMKLAALVDQDKDSVGNYLEPGYVLTSTDGGATWTEQISSWWEGDAIASSADGATLVIATNGGISVSTDSGATWVKRFNRDFSSSPTWTALTMSADGGRLAAAARNGYIYTSADNGVTWTEQTESGQRGWRCIAGSAEGDRLAAATYYVYTSADGGLTWTEQAAAGDRLWNDVASSADGMKLAAVVRGGYIYTSIDGGRTWTERISAGRRPWTCITSSADGSRLAAGTTWLLGSDRLCHVYVSTDGGATWTQSTSGSSTGWLSIASSADGASLAAVSRYVYTSTDGGVSWTERTSSVSSLKTDISCSADGTGLAVIGGWGDDTCVQVSRDGGATWSRNVFRGSWDTGGHITVSADGTKLAALVSFPSPDISSSYPDINFSCVETSKDGGITWTSQTGLVSSDWTCITSSADGTRLAAGVQDEGVYTSSDSGATWALCSYSGSRHWRSIASSADGTRLAAVSAWDDNIFTSP